MSAMNAVSLVALCAVASIAMVLSYFFVNNAVEPESWMWTVYQWLCNLPSVQISLVTVNGVGVVVVMAVAFVNSEVRELQSLSSGTYYASCADIFEGIQGEFSESHYEAMHRDRGYRGAAFFRPGSNEQLYEYEETFRYFESQDAETADSTSTSASQNTLLFLVHPQSVFGSPSVSAKLAHLVPDARSCSDYFHHVANWTFGVQYSREKAEEQKDALLKLIHGAKAADRPRVDHTGMRHMLSNFVRLTGQKTFYDNYPAVLIVPLFVSEDPLGNVRKWRGESYSAMVIAAACDEEPIEMQSISEKGGASVGMNAGDRIEACEGYLGIQLITKMDQCSHEELESAANLLANVTRALAYALQGINVGNDTNVERPVKQTVDELRQAKEKMARDQKVTVPKLLHSWRRGRVCKIKFANTSDAAATCHRAPDPLFLTVKAAVNWSRLCGERLLPGCVPPLDDFEGLEDADLYRQAALEYGEYLDSHRDSHRPSVPEEIFIG